MNLVVNGEPHTGAEGLTLRELLRDLKYDPTFVAISVNCEFVPRTAYDSYRLSVGDDVEVLSPRQGG